MAAPAAPETTAGKLVLPQPFVLVVANLKGGVGKTTTAFFLACYFAQLHGLRVAVIDADPLSQTGYLWVRKLRRAGGAFPFTLEVFPSAHIDDKIEDMVASGDWDVIIADTGGESDAIMKAAVRKAHELLIIAATSESELDRIPPTFKAAQEAVKDVDTEIGVQVLLTKVPTAVNSTEESEARKTVDEAGFDCLQACAHNWKWYRTAYPNSHPMDDLAEYVEIAEEAFGDYFEEAA